MKRGVFGLVAFLLFAGCAKNDTCLTGKREHVITSNVGIEASHNAGKLILVPSDKNPLIGTLKFAKNIKPIWQYKFYDLNLNGNIMAASPVVADSKAFILDAGGVVHCLDAKCGKLLWKTYTTVVGETGQSGGAIAHTKGTLLVSTAFGEVFFINANTGKTEARMKLPSPCKGDGILIENNRAYFSCIANDVCAVDLSTHKIIWTYKEIERDNGYLGMAQPISHKDNLLITSSSGELICLNKVSGKEIWKILLSNYSVTDATSAIVHIRATPVVDNNVVYVNSPSGTIYAINADSGDIIWSHNIGSLTPINISGNHLFIINESAEVACINKHDGRVLSLNRIDIPQRKELAIISWFSSVSKHQKNIIFQFLTDHYIMHITSAGNIILSEYNSNTAIAKHITKHPISVRPILLDQALYVLSDDGYLMKYAEK